MLGLGAAMAARGKASKGSEDRMESFMLMCVYVYVQSGFGDTL
jgi:hypothetical protein